MKKQGFTLIELMVVIVIMGILAAVAVPKLFGMIAKSKASEVGPAAGEYVKLQQAYFAEKVMYGTWQNIGYTGPGTAPSNNTSSTYSTNFRYDGGAITSETTAAAIGWQASNIAKLNDCSAGTHWQVTTKTVGSDSKDAYEAQMASDSNGGCAAVTPSFTLIGK